MIHAWILKGQHSLILLYLKTAIVLSVVMHVLLFHGFDSSIVYDFNYEYRIHLFRREKGRYLTQS